jgi:hypothetical protein
MGATASHTIEDNSASAARVFIDCVQRGIPAYVPQAIGCWPSAWVAISWEHWIAYDCAVIDRCTHVLMLPRWETSKGAQVERAYALDRGVPVIYALSDLPAAPAVALVEESHV